MNLSCFRRKLLGYFFSIKSYLHNHKPIQYLIIIGLVFRLVIYLFYNHYTIFPDTSAYLRLAKTIVELNFSQIDGTRSPGFPLLIIMAFGNFYLLMVYQFILGILTAIVWYLTLVNLEFSKKSSFYITLFLQSFLYVVIYETTVMVETLVLFVISIVIFIITSNFYLKSRLKHELVLSAMLGLLVLIKPFYVYVPFLILLFGLITYIFQKKSNIKISAILGKKMALFIFPLLVYFGWSYVNKINNGYFVSTTYFGLNLSQNCTHFAEKGDEKYDWIIEPLVKHRDLAINENRDDAMAIWYAINEGEFKSYNLKFADLSYHLGEFAKSTILDNKMDYLKQVIFKSWWHFWKPSLSIEFEEYKFEKGTKIFATILDFQNSFLKLIKLFFLLIIPYYIVTFIKHRIFTLTHVLIMFAFVPSVLQAMVTYGTNNRFSFPFEYVMIIVVVLFFKKMRLSVLVKFNS